LVDGLQDAGFVVQLVNTAAVKQYDGLKHGGDFEDARHLAHLLRLGILPTGYICPREQRAVRDLLRKRSQLVCQRSAQFLSVGNLIARNLGTHCITTGPSPVALSRCAWRLTGARAQGLHPARPGGRGQRVRAWPVPLPDRCAAWLRQARR
ncbi:MAG: hypothetical protein Q8L92_16700, partial [Rubrivivax sp.]|nr:hypothetical protein [Rubrivivax sp.]